MMQSLDDILLAVVVALALGCIVLTLQIIHMRLRRRTIELETAKQSLIAHYDAMDRIVNDPALPTSVLHFLAFFSDAIADRDSCARIVKALMSADADKSPAPISSDIDALRKTRPDLVENIHKAVFNGTVFVFSRWPGNFGKLPQIMAVLGDPKKDVQVAYRFARSAEVSYRKGFAAA